MAGGRPRGPSNRPRPRERRRGRRRIAQKPIRAGEGCPRSPQGLQGDDGDRESEREPAFTRRSPAGSTRAGRPAGRLAAIVGASATGAPNAHHATPRSAYTPSRASPATQARVGQAGRRRPRAGKKEGRRPDDRGVEERSGDGQGRRALPLRDEGRDLGVGGKTEGIRPDRRPEGVGKGRSNRDDEHEQQSSRPRAPGDEIIDQGRRDGCRAQEEAAVQVRPGEHEEREQPDEARAAVAQGEDREHRGEQHDAEQLGAEAERRDPDDEPRKREERRGARGQPPTGARHDERHRGGDKDRPQHDQSAPRPSRHARRRTAGRPPTAD